MTCSFFLLLFVSLWFKHYSVHLVGERRDKVGMRGELMICDFANHRAVDRVIHVGTHLWCLANYYGCFKQPNDLAVVALATMPIVLFRCLVMMIELRLACARIIDFDVEEKNSGISDPTAAKASPEKDKKKSK